MGSYHSGLFGLAPLNTLWLISFKFNLFFLKIFLVNPNIIFVFLQSGYFLCLFFFSVIHLLPKNWALGNGCLTFTSSYNRSYQCLILFFSYPFFSSPSIFSWTFIIPFSHWQNDVMYLFTTTFKGRLFSWPNQWNLHSHFLNNSYGL